jgi:hypothetical protein
MDKDTVELNISNMSKEEKAQAWSNWVRHEINALLDMYLPVSNEGDINIQYHYAVKEVFENGPEYHDSLADAVMITMVFKFSELMDITLNQKANENQDEEK